MTEIYDPKSLFSLLPSIKNSKFVFVGEVHGSNEIPGLFADLVDLLSRETEEIGVAFEIQENNQINLQNAKRANSLYDMPNFKEPRNDGLSSEAMFEAIKRCANISNAKLFAFDSPSEKWINNDSNGRDYAMAENLKRQSCEIAGPLLILSGNIHASKTNFPIEDEVLATAANYLCRQFGNESVFSILVEFLAGMTWSSCPGKEPPILWQAISESVEAYTDSLNINKQQRMQGYDALIILDKVTASPPLKKISSAPRP